MSTEETPAPQRRRRRKALDVNTEAQELLAMTLRSTKAKMLWHEDQDIPVDAATISASVSLLKLVDAMKRVDQDEQADDLAQQRAAFEAQRAQRTTTPSTAQSVLELYGQSGTSGPALAT